MSPAPTPVAVAATFPCPACGNLDHYRLADGRRKCRACGDRFSPTSAWDSIRLPELVKQRLLACFAQGLTCRQPLPAAIASTPTRERFYRLLRACCAHAEGLDAPFVTMQDPGLRSSSPIRTLVFGLSKRAGRVVVTPIVAEDRASLLRAIDLHMQLPVEEWRACVSLRLQGEIVQIRKDRQNRPDSERCDDIARFWECAKRQLGALRGASLRYFHLYMGEICFRYNNRGKSLERLLLLRMRETPARELRDLLPRPRSGRARTAV